MKFNLSIIALLALLTATAFFVSGCSLFPGYDADEIQRIAKERQEELQAQADKVRAIETAIVELRDAYEEAQRQGDTQALIELGKQLFQKTRELDVGREDLAQIRESAEATLGELRDAEGAGGYLNVLLGTLAALFGLGGAGGIVANRTKTSALRATANNIEATLNDTQLAAFKAAQRAALNDREAKAINKARGK